MLGLRNKKIAYAGIDIGKLPMLDLTCSEIDYPSLPE
jgi:hypothetical protein